MKALTYSLGMLSLIANLGLAQPPAKTTNPAETPKTGCGCHRCKDCNCDQGCKCDTDGCSCKTCKCKGGCHEKKH